MIGGEILIWIAKLSDNDMAQCNLCVTHLSISSGGRTDVRRHQESARHAKLAKSKGSTKDGMVQLNMLHLYRVYSNCLKCVGILFASANFLSRVFALISLTFAPAQAKC